MAEDFDKFDRPAYSREDAMLESPSIGGRIAPITNALGRHKKAIIGLIIIAAIGYFAYDFFIGSYKTVDFSLENTEGTGLSANSFKIFDMAGNKIFETSGSKTISARLKPGDYKIEAKASSDYKAVAMTVTVSESAEETIQFEKNINAQIIGFSENFPKTLVAGQSAAFDITIENKNPEAQEIKIVPSKELEKITIEIPVITVPGNSGETVTVSVSVPDSIKITNLSAGDNLSGSIRIKYTNIKESLPAGAKVFPAPILKISPTSLALSGDAGKDIIKDFTITNDSAFTVYDLNMEIEITTISKNSEEEILQSIEFTQGKTIDSLQGKGTKQNTFQNKLRFNIPITAKSEQITANIVLDSRMLPQPIRWPIILKVNSEANFGITVTPSTKAITINYNTSLGRFETKTGNIKVQNTGQMPLANIHLETENKDECTSRWLKFNETEISSLAKGGIATLPIELSAPVGNNGVPMDCRIRYWHDDPTKDGDRVSRTVTEWTIKITPKTT